MREEGTEEIHDALGGCREVIEFKERVPQDPGEINDLMSRTRMDITKRLRLT